jgi:hypothetical protein
LAILTAVSAMTRESLIAMWGHWVAALLSTPWTCAGGDDHFVEVAGSWEMDCQAKTPA